MKKSLGAKTIAAPLPVWCIATYDKNGNPNVMTASWAGICCSKPPAIGVSLRKATYSYQSILDSKAFTVNVPSAKYAIEADFFGIASGKDTDKFNETGFTPVRSEIVNAPYISEFPLVIECRLIHHIEIGLHTQFIGEIMDVKADVGILDEGKIISEALDTFIYATSSRTYHTIQSSIGKAFTIGKDFRKI